MISTSFSIVGSIKSLTKVLQPGCSLKKPLPKIKITSFNPVEGNFILKDGSYFITKDNLIFNVKD